MSDIIYLTKERMQEIEEELRYLQIHKRKEIAEKIAEARSHGDLSDNSDYDAAKDEQALLELRIAKLSQILAKAQVIKAEEFPDDKVYILSNVTMKNLATGATVTYKLVSAEEADFEQNKISVNSPLGKAMMGKKVGDIVEVKVPAGVNRFEILSISK
ncbi:MAG TPA: transcription elongation factor GreA [Candidatus Kapabacteria bacterium]|nr:transcription elongation factor GreA [Candidatus Kapabacteria bacterium]HOQ49805.1 transcription elongation factor GreA [Candidatus Kapabacteria bacterium]